MTSCARIPLSALLFSVGLVSLPAAAQSKPAPAERDEQGEREVILTGAPEEPPTAVYAAANVPLALVFDGLLLNGSAVVVPGADVRPHPFLANALVLTPSKDLAAQGSSAVSVPLVDRAVSLTLTFRPERRDGLVSFVRRTAAARSDPTRGPAASRVPSSRAFPPDSCWKAFTVASVAAISACYARVPTGTKAGDCSIIPARKVNGVPLPEELHVYFVSLNGKECTGGYSHFGRPLEPCPAGDGDIEVKIWGAPDMSPFFKGMKVKEAPHLYGKAHVVPTPREKLREPADFKIPRDAAGKLTALFTEMRMHDGTSVPICGVLFDVPGRSSGLGGEGIPVLDPKYFGPNVAPTWGDATVKLFYPPP